MRFGGLLLIAVSIYFFSLSWQSDLIASVLSAAIIIFLFFAFLVALANYLFVLSTLKVEFNPENYQLITQSNAKFFGQLLLRGLKVFPFIQLRITPVFNTKDNLQAPAIFLRTQQLTEISLSMPLVFMHRGNWELKSILVSVEDLAGLFSFSKRFRVNKTIAVSPAETRYQERQLIVSTFKSGDLINLPSEPQGDYYDLKRYNPADGINKLVWKIYARTGELVSRKQEQTAEPNGKILVYALASLKDDHLASESLNYLTQLINYDAEFQFSCYSASKTGSKAVNLVEQAKVLLIDQAWQTTTLKSSGKARFEQVFDELQALCTRNTGSFGSTKIAVFCTQKDAELIQQNQARLSAALIDCELFEVSDPKAERTAESGSLRLIPKMFFARSGNNR